MSYWRYKDYLTRLIYEIFRGKKLKEGREIILFASLLYWSVVLIFCRCLRLFVSEVLIPNPNTKFKVILSGLLIDFICAFQTTACSLERGFIYTAYGIFGYLTALFVLGVIYSYTFNGGSGNPCSTYSRYLHSVSSLQLTVITILTQVCGSLCGFYFALQWWGLGATSRHTNRLQTYLTDGCTTDITVAFFYGCMIEFFGTLGEFLLTLSKPLLLYIISEQMFLYTRVFLSCMITWSGLDLTGMWNNPANATAQKFSCRGTSNTQHIVVYWFSPLFATRFAYFLEKLFSSRSKSPPVKDINSNEPNSTINNQTTSSIALNSSSTSAFVESENHDHAD